MSNGRHVRRRRTARKHAHLYQRDVDLHCSVCGAAVEHVVVYPEVREGGPGFTLSLACGDCFHEVLGYGLSSERRVRRRFGPTLEEDPDQMTGVWHCSTRAEVEAVIATFVEAFPEAKPAK